MNRYVLAPGILSLVGFMVFCSMGPSKAPAFVPSTTTPMTVEQATTQILDGWPVGDSYRSYGSRSEPFYFYTELGQLADTGSESGFLSALDIVCNFQNDSELRSKRFPIHVNRYTGLVRIFVDQQWRSYEDWKEENREVYFKAAGLPYTS